MLVATTSHSQTKIAEWNFESSSRQPSSGTGTLTLIGGVTEDWTKTGINSGISTLDGISDEFIDKVGVGLQTSDYPIATLNPKTAGIRISVNTTGYQDIILSADVRVSNTCANKIVLQYTTNGSNWIDAASFTSSGGDKWYLRNFNFSRIAGVSNNSNFSVRFVTDFDGTSYVASKSSSVYAITGAIRFDNISVKGTPTSSLVNYSTIAGWNFDGLNKNATTGTGTLSLIGGVTEDWTKKGVFENASLPEGVLDIDELKDGAGLQTLGYPAINSNAKTAGIQINASTVGYEKICISADVRHGNTSANKVVLQYTVNGNTWIDATTFTSTVGDTWYDRNYDFTSVSGIDNNPNFGLRFVTNFDGTSYVATRSTSTYATTGPIRFDNVKIKGVAVSAGTSTINEVNWTIYKNQLIFKQIAQQSIEVFSLSGSKVAVYDPALIIEVDLPRGIYLVKSDNVVKKMILQ